MAEILIQENFQREENQLKKGSPTSLIVVLKKKKIFYSIHSDFLSQEFLSTCPSWFKIFNVSSLPLLIFSYPVLYIFRKEGRKFLQPPLLCSISKNLSKTQIRNLRTTFSLLAPSNDTLSLESCYIKPRQEPLQTVSPPFFANFGSFLIRCAPRQFGI